MARVWHLVVYLLKTPKRTKNEPTVNYNEWRKKIMTILDSRFFKIQGIVKNRQKMDSFDIHNKKHLKTTASCTDLRKFTILKLV